VFTTLHTNDAPGAFTRLEDMGVEPFLMSSSTIGILAQRLARRICTKCKEEIKPDEATAKFFGYEMDDLPTFYKGKGCDNCGGNGYKGRVGVYEVLLMNDELRRLVASGAKSDDIRIRLVGWVPQLSAISQRNDCSRQLSPQLRRRVLS
jgi:type II secretory ATPase GspE/PulE/Tfp pilus assembly ATPase PilB-like protein